MPAKACPRCKQESTCKPHATLWWTEQRAPSFRLPDSISALGFAHHGSATAWPKFSDLRYNALRDSIRQAFASRLDYHFFLLEMALMLNTGCQRFGEVASQRKGGIRSSQYS